jgi:FkbM family methyltransferase
MTLNFYTKLKIFILNFLIVSHHIDFYRFLIKNFKKSKSQVFQDLFVLFYTNKKINGNFIEIGGGNGIDISNSYILEKNHKWDGIICEPNSLLAESIKKNRSAELIKMPITKKCKDKIAFYENKDPYQSSVLKTETSQNKVFLESLCLNHLILKKKLINKIDYISIDTEGNEYEILKNFNFKKFKIKIFTIEHNFETSKRNKIYQLMKKNNYKRVFKYLSYMDDWYLMVTE